MKTIEIYDKKNNLLIPELEDILDIFNNEGEQYKWFIVDLEATGDLGSNQTMLDLMERIENSYNGIEIAWQDLRTLSEKISQGINIRIIGIHKDKRPYSKVPSQKDYDISIELIDSSYWVIKSVSCNHINYIHNKFNSTKLVIN